MTIAPAFGLTTGVIPANMDGGESTASYSPTQNTDGGNAKGDFNENVDGGNA